MAKQKFTVLIEKDEDSFYVATVPELEGCHTQAKTIPELMKRAKEAIEVCVEARQLLQAESKTRFVGIKRLDVNVKTAPRKAGAAALGS